VSESATLKRALQVAAAAVVLFAGGAVIVGSSACASAPDKERVTDVLQPDLGIYRQFVDLYLQRRCGTLDCHGQPGRAYRVYGTTGFRLVTADAGLVTGQQPTTDDERLANFQAIVGLEPEEMSRLVATQGADPNKLIFLRKPLKLERHKGGPAMAEEDSGYKCVVAWLRIPTINVLEDGSFEGIPPEGRQQLSPNAQAFCKEAEGFP
jgi:hypothetical protein